MANCPVCGSAIQDDFGLVTCPSCGSAVLIDMEGASPPPAPPSQDPEPLSTFESAAEPVFDAPVPEESLVIPPASPDMRELASFGNSEESQAREGSLRYNLFIQGLDTVEVRRDFRDVIADRKFLWDPEQVMSRIVQGELRLESLTAVKCSILVQRLRSLPVEVRWEQYAIQQA